MTTTPTPTQHDIETAVRRLAERLAERMPDSVLRLDFPYAPQSDEPELSIGDAFFFVGVLAWRDHLPIIAAHALAEMARRGWEWTIMPDIGGDHSPGVWLVDLWLPKGVRTAHYKYDLKDPTAKAYAELLACIDALTLEQEQNDE